MQANTTKEKAYQLLDKLPDSATWEAILGSQEFKAKNKELWNRIKYKTTNRKAAWPPWSIFA
jgi:hypothetical protein